MFNLPLTLNPLTLMLVMHTLMYQRYKFKNYIMGSRIKHKIKLFYRITANLESRYLPKRYNENLLKDTLLHCAIYCVLFKIAHEQKRGI